jgi:DNA-binding Xre family transcriptional regulator
MRPAPSMGMQTTSDILAHCCSFCSRFFSEAAARRAAQTTVDRAQRAIAKNPANMSLLKTGKVKGVRFATLEAICEALDCRPGDILEYQPAEQGRGE